MLTVLRRLALLALFVLACAAAYVRCTLLTPHGLYTGWWPQYRLGDVVLFQPAYSDHAYRIVLRLFFSQTLANKYLHAATSSRQIDVLAKLVHERAQRDHNAPLPGTAVVHVRVGDVIECDVHSVDEFCAHQQRSRSNGLCFVDPGWRYVKPLSYYREMHIPKTIRRITIVAGAHVRLSSYTKSHEYLRRVEVTLRNATGLPVDGRYGRSPDDDFVQMVLCDHLVPSGGHFSVLAHFVHGFVHGHHQRKSLPQTQHSFRNLYPRQRLSTTRQAGVLRGPVGHT